MTEHSIPVLSDDDIDRILFENKHNILHEIRRIINLPDRTLQASNTQIRELGEILSRFELPINAFSRLKPFRWYLFFYNENISEVALVMNNADTIENNTDVIKPSKSPKKGSKSPKKSGYDDFIVDNPEGNLFIEKCGSVPHHPHQIIDLNYRTEKIVEDLNESDKTGIDTLDGHGRTLYLLLHHIYTKRILKKIDLTFFELNDDTHKWHTIFFPQRQPVVNDPRLGVISITLKKGNIFDQYSEDIFRLKQKILYLNFLSLGGKEEIEELLKMLKYMNKSGLKSIVYISFTARPYSNKSIYTPVAYKPQFMRGTVQVYFRYDITKYIIENFKCVCRRNLFVTYKLILTEEKQVLTEDEHPTKRSRHDILSSESDGGYYNKYLKYKQKYIQLKNELNNLKL